MQDSHCYGNRSSSIFLFQFCCQKCRLCLLEKTRPFGQAQHLRRGEEGTLLSRTREATLSSSHNASEPCSILVTLWKSLSFCSLLSCFKDIDTPNKMDHNKRGTEDRTSDAKKILNVPKPTVTLMRWLVFSTLCYLEKEGQTSGNHQVCYTQYSPDPSPQFLSPLLTPTCTYTLLCGVNALETLCKREGRG